MSGTVHFREAAPVLHFQIMPGDNTGKRNRVLVELPLRFKLRLDDEVEQCANDDGELVMKLKCRRLRGEKTNVVTHAEPRA